MESSLSLAHPHNIDDGGANQKHDKEEDLGSSGSIDDALRDGSADRMMVAQSRNVMGNKNSIAAVARKRGCHDPRWDPAASSSRLVAVVIQSRSSSVVIEEGGCSIMLGNTSRGWGGGLNSDRLGCDWARPVRCGWCGLARSFRSVLKLHICSADVCVYIYMILVSHFRLPIYFGRE
jgi:hypothetical protein